MSVLSDLRYSTTSLARTPGLTLALLFTIALGIGSNAAVFGFIRGLVARPIPLPHSDRLISIFSRDGASSLGPVSYERYLELKSQAGVVDALGAIRESRETVIIAGQPMVMSIAAVTTETAALLQLPIHDGVVISRRAWLNEFGARGKIRGEAIRVGDTDTRVAEVAPEWLEGLYLGRVVDVWIPLEATAIQGPDRASQTFWILGRLTAGSAPRQTQAAMSATLSPGQAIALLPYTGLGPEAAGGMARLGTLLPAAAGAVFIIACANVAAFLLSRASARARETAVRVALGAGRRQLARQLLADSVVLSVAGGAGGALLATWTAQIIPAFFFDEDAARLVFVPDLTGIFVASAACALVTAACGLLPLVEIRDDDPARVLRRESGGPSPAMQRVRSALVVAEMACCCLLVLSTGLLLAGFRAALATSTGSRLGQPILARVQAAAGFGRPDLGLQYYHDVERAALELPGIHEAAWVATPPGSRAGWQSIRVDPAPVRTRDAVMTVVPFVPQTLAQVVVPPLAGRMFSGADTPGACPVAIVNKEAADAFFNGHAVGRSIEDLAGRRVEIVGVVANRKVEKAAPPNRPIIYYYAQQAGLRADEGGATTFRVPEYPRSELKGVLDANVVSRSYFTALDAPPVNGRLFDDEPGPEGCRVAVVNEEAAELYFGGHAVGGGVIDAAGVRTSIVGVVHASQLRATQRRPEPAIYFPLGQDYLPRMTLILGARHADAAAVATVQRQLETVGGGKPMQVITLEEHLSRTALAAERIATILVGASAATALALGILGIAGALADFTRHRRREIALRMALGAQHWRVIGQVVRQGLRLAGIGALAGGVASLAVARWLSRITPDAGSLALWAWLAAPGVLLVAVIIASVLPVGRALAVNPLTVMRNN